MWIVTFAAVVGVAAVLGWQRSKSVRTTIGWALLGVVAGSLMAGIASYVPTGSAVVAGVALVALLLAMVGRRLRAS